LSDVDTDDACGSIGNAPDTASPVAQIVNLLDRRVSLGRRTEKLIGDGWLDGASGLQIRDTAD